VVLTATPLISGSANALPALTRVKAATARAIGKRFIGGFLISLRCLGILGFDPLEGGLVPRNDDLRDSAPRARQPFLFDRQALLLGLGRVRARERDRT
jgi:hypothetical protein